MLELVRAVYRAKAGKDPQEVSFNEDCGGYFDFVFPEEHHRMGLFLVRLHGMDDVHHESKKNAVARRYGLTWGNNFMPHGPMEGQRRFFEDSAMLAGVPVPPPTTRWELIG